MTITRLLQEQNLVYSQITNSKEVYDLEQNQIYSFSNKQTFQLNYDHSNLVSRYIFLGWNAYDLIIQIHYDHSNLKKYTWIIEEQKFQTILNISVVCIAT